MAGATAALNNEDHSLTPNTSEMSSCDKNIIEIARSLTLDYISYRLRSKLEQSKLQGLPRHFLIPPQSPTNVLTSTLRKLATDTEAKYPDLFESVCKKLDITPVSAYRTFVCVAQEIFQEGPNCGFVCVRRSRGSPFRGNATTRNGSEDRGMDCVLYCP